MHLRVADRGIDSANKHLFQVARSSDFGINDRILLAKTHLGHLLHPGDTVLGYDLLTAQLADPELDQYLEKGLSLPDTVLVSLASLPPLSLSYFEVGLVTRQRALL